MKRTNKRKCKRCGTPIHSGDYCMKPDCQNARHRLHKTPSLQSYTCHGCGETFTPKRKLVNLVFPPFCKKPECRRAKARMEWERYSKRNETEEMVELAIGHKELPATFRDIYSVNVVPRGNEPCGTCRWREHCVASVKVALWPACELPDDRDKMRLEKSAYNNQMMMLLQERMTF